MALTLLAGPANAGKVALLLERYLATLADEPVLIVPNRSDVDRVERELLRHAGALVVGRVLARASLNGWSRSARFAGFGESLAAAVGEHESGLVDPAALDGPLGGLYGAYREELDRLDLWDRDLERRRAAERVQGELEAWDGRPVFAYGFEDLTGAQWALLQT